MFVIRGNQVFLDASPHSPVVPALEYWEANENGKGLPDLECLGLATPFLRVTSDSSEMQLQVILRTERGEIAAPSRLRPSWDSVVINNYWIPLHSTEHSDLWHVIETAEASLTTPLTYRSLFSILKTAMQFDVDVQTPEDLNTLVTPSATATGLEGMMGTPYRYQEIGINWLSDYFDNGVGALLCDEMGLGKTFQIIGLIAHANSCSELPIIIVCPATLTANWIAEFEKFLPGVKPYLHAGGTRSFLPEDFEQVSVVITSYDLLVRDIALFDSLSFSLAVFDEAQALKNRTSQRHMAAMKLPALSKVLVTGTPVENSLNDLWSLTNVAYEGLLGSFREFESLVSAEPTSARKLGQRVTPLILRRLVADVAQDLPELVEIDEPIHPTPKFAVAYENIRAQSDGTDTDNSFLITLGNLTQSCCYPGLLIDGYSDNEDAKFTRLAEILDELHEVNRDKVIIFSTFIKSIDMLLAFVARRFGDDRALRLDGSIPMGDRQNLINHFNTSLGFRVLIINPTVGGSGLNITGANHVIHFNRQWNPKLERQATARSYRRGQEKTVFVHKFFYLGTVEQVINERQLTKEILADAAMSGAMSDEEEISRSRALLLSPTRTI